MTNDKLELVSASDGARPLLGMPLRGSEGTVAFDNAIRAQLMCVAVGVGGTGSHTAKMLIDLSVYLSLDDSYAAFEGGASPAIVLIPSQPRSLLSGMCDAHEWDRANMLIPYWSSVCTQPRASCRFEQDLTFPIPAQPMTLRLLFEADSKRRAEEAAVLLCEGFSAWHAATTSLAEAMAAIRTTLLDPWHKQERISVPLTYRSALVCQGWRRRIADPMSFLQASSVSDRSSDHVAYKALSDIFAQRFEAAWHETARSLQNLESLESDDEGLGTECQDLAESGDAADDYVCSGKMVSLWYGEKKRRRRTGWQLRP